MGAHLNVKGLVFRVRIPGDQIMEYLQLLIMAWTKYFYGNQREQISGKKNLKGLKSQSHWKDHVGIF